MKSIVSIKLIIAKSISNYFRDEISDNFDDLNSSGLASTMDSSDAAPESSFV